MPRPTVNQPAGSSPDDTLLSALLADDLPSRHGSVQRARLRSVRQQQAEALRGFRLRNWVDRTLLIIERGLVLTAVLALIYWLADGYGRDWFHYERQNLAAMQALPAEAAEPASAAIPVLLNTAVPAETAAALPFTRPEASNNAGADAFLVPQAARAAPVANDPRPVRLSMPSLGATMEVYEVGVVNGEWEVAEYAAGYHVGTALPGNDGNTVISGHAGLRGAVFRDLGSLQPGDEIVVETAGWRYVYRVQRSFKVWPNQVEVMYPTLEPTLTLITCTNWDTQRLIVVAELVDARPLS